MEKPLAGKRILVPPARPETNPLIRILSTRGAHTYEFPALQAVPPQDYDAIDRAIGRLNDFDCVIFSGTNCVTYFLERLDDLHVNKTVLGQLQVVAIGHGAVSALKKASVTIDMAPRVHTAEGVTAALGEISNRTFLLVRVQDASRKLPQRLQSLGAGIIEVAGY